MSTTTNPSDDSSPLDFCKKVKEKVDPIFESLQSVPMALPPLRRKRVAVDIQHAEYMARLESFNKVPGRWFLLPESVSPVSLAVHGWSAFNESTVKCGECGGFLSVKVPTPNVSSPKAAGFAVKYITNNMRSSHSNSCRWHSKEPARIPEESYNLLDAFSKIRNFFKKSRIQAPKIVSKNPDESFLLEDPIRMDLADFLEEDEDACLLALYGWLPDPASRIQNEGLKCRFCATRIVVKPYSLPSDFHPIKFHQRYCPIRSNTQSHVVNIVLKALANKNHFYALYYRMDDVLLGSSESEDVSSEEEVPSMLDIPDNLTYRWPKNIVEIGEASIPEELSNRKIQLKLHRASDKICAFGSMGNTRICCVVMTPVNESDQEDFEAGVSVKLKGATYVNEITLRDCIQSIIPSSRLKRTFIDIAFHVYSDAGNVIPTALMTVLLALTASRVDVKGIVTCVTVLITPEGNLVVNPTKEEEQKARDKIPEFAYVTVMKVMKDDHVRWWDVEGLPKASQVSKAMAKASSEASALYPHMATIVQKLMESGENEF
ncbi:hypothetical protein FO519_006631 [Halicephalobus sp. NKZ332]|nr:hypothetical protein FO519_006631 [Halicephalobus sp. NKZ332]